VSSELEQAGDLATAALAAASIEQTSVPASGHPSGAGVCANCGAALSGRFCQDCGQAAHLHRSLLHLVEELLHSVLHFDAKGWRTLPLLAFRPGLLTRRYLEGQRTRYLSPLALFLFTGFLMFFVVSLSIEHLHAPATDPVARAAARQQLRHGVEEARQDLEHAGAELRQAQHTGQGLEQAQAALQEAQQAQRVAETAQHWADLAMASGAATVSESGQAARTEGGSALRLLAAWAEPRVDTGQPRIDALLHHALRNPDLYLYRLENTASKFLFLLIPISLPFLWLMFLGRGIAVYDHAVFSLYSLSFMSLLIVGCALLALPGLGALAVLLFLFVPPVHMFLQLLENYRLGPISALWRTVMLLGVAGTAFLLFLLFILAMSLR